MENFNVTVLVVAIQTTNFNEEHIFLNNFCITLYKHYSQNQNQKLSKVNRKS